jgi:TolB-like protein
MDAEAMRTLQIFPVIILCAALAPCGAGEKPAKAPPKAWVAVFDFKTSGRIKANSQVLQGRSYGHQLADSVRLKIRKQIQNSEVVDRLTTADISGPLDLDADTAKVRKMMTEKLGVNLAIYGEVRSEGKDVAAQIRCIDLRAGMPGRTWTRTFSDRTERARAEIARAIVEAAFDTELWRPPEYGDEQEPTLKQLGGPVNENGGFETGHKGWDRPDNVSTFLEKGPAGRGTILRIKTKRLHLPGKGTCGPRHDTAHQDQHRPGSVAPIPQGAAQGAGEPGQPPEDRGEQRLQQRGRDRGRPFPQRIHQGETRLEILAAGRPHGKRRHGVPEGLQAHGARNGRPA